MFYQTRRNCEVPPPLIWSDFVPVSACEGSADPGSAPTLDQTGTDQAPRRQRSGNGRQGLRQGSNKDLAIGRSGRLRGGRAA